MELKHRDNKGREWEEALLVSDIWPDEDAAGLRDEVRRQWPQLADALDAHCRERTP